MKIGIFFNPNQVEIATVEAFVAAIEKAGSYAVVFSREEEISNIERLIVLGGDGTVLRAARRASELDIPLFGVNYGHLGFLTEFERGTLDEAVSLALNEHCDRVERSMLEVELKGIRTVCLNECVLMRSVAPGEEMELNRFAMAIDGRSAGEVVADGLIVTTPTGSTAYSLSAGGSIMTPDCAAFMLTPVCAISMRSRPIVYDSSSELTFSLSEGSLLLYGDGRFLGQIGKGDVLTVRKAARSAAFLTCDRAGYFRRLTEKIN